MGLERAALAMLVSLIACGGERRTPAPGDDRPPPVVPPPPAAAEAREVFLRGVVHMVPTLSFRSCDGQALAAAQDSTRDHLVPAYRVLQPDDEEGMYAEVIGGQLPGGALILRRLEFASRTGPGQGCDQPATGHILRAYGVRPEWQVLVTGSGIEFTQAVEPMSLSFPATLPDDSAGVLRYQTAGGLHMLLTQSPCTVDSTLSFGSMQAIVKVGGKTLRGCASHGGVR